MDSDRDLVVSKYRGRHKKRRVTYASVLGGDLRRRARAAHDAATDDDEDDDEPLDETSDDTSPGTSDGEREEDGDDSDSDDKGGWANTPAAATASPYGELYLPEYCGDQRTNPLDFLVDVEAWLRSRCIRVEAWVDVAIERLFGLPRAWALLRYSRWLDWGSFRRAFLARFWNEAAKMELVNQFFASKYCRKDFGSTANYVMFWLNKVRHLLLEKTNKSYTLDRYSFLYGLGRQLPPEARAVLLGRRILSNEELLAGLRRSDRLPGRDNYFEVNDDYSLPFF